MVASLRDGRFVLLGALGEGSQGATFDGVDKREGRAVAIKRFQVRGARSWKDVELAEREARVLSQLDHRRLPAYIDHFEEGGALYLVMEKIEGESLASLRKRGASLAEADVVRLLRDASEVLDYLHGLAPPVIHRDLKPGNVLRRPDGSYAFVDFGAVRDRLRPEGGSTVVGTFGYMAPEQFQGRASPGSDVYAIGATAITMLTGCQPEELPHRGLAIDVEAALRGRASKPLVAAIARMLEPDPDVRPGRIAPLIAGLPAAETARPDARRRDRGDDGDNAPRVERAERADRAGRVDRASRRADRKADRAHRRAEKRARWRDSVRLPWPLALALSVALTLASLAVTIGLRVLAPLVLWALSPALGKGLRRTASEVSEAGRRTSKALAEAARSLVRDDRAGAAASDGGDASPPRGPRRVRITDDDRGPAAADREAEAEAEAAADEARDRSRRRR